MAHSDVQVHAHYSMRPSDFKCVWKLGVAARLCLPSVLSVPKWYHPGYLRNFSLCGSPFFLFIT